MIVFLIKPIKFNQIHVQTHSSLHALHSQQHLQRGNIHLGLLANFALRQLGRLVRQHPNALGSVEPRVLEGTPDGGIFGLDTPPSELGQGSVQLEAGRPDDAGLS